MRSKIALRHSLRNEGKKRKIHVYYMYIVERDLGLDFKPWLPLTDCIILRTSPSPWVGGSVGFSFLMLKWENWAVGSGILWGFSCFSKPRKNIFSPMCPNSPGKSQKWQDGFVIFFALSSVCVALSLWVLVNNSQLIWSISQFSLCNIPARSMFKYRVVQRYYYLVKMYCYF